MTFAELDFILQDSDTWPQVRLMHGLTYEASDAIATAGLASLLARDLATVEGEDIVVDPQVSGCATAFGVGGEQIALVLVANDIPIASVLQVNPEKSVRLLISAAGPGVFELQALRDDNPLGELLFKIICEVVSQGDNIAIGYGDSVLQIAHTSAGWATRTDVEAELEQVDEARLRAAIDVYVQQVGV